MPHPDACGMYLSHGDACAIVMHVAQCMSYGDACGTLYMEHVMHVAQCMWHMVMHVTQCILSGKRI